MFLIIKIVFGNVWIFGCNTDQLVVLKQFTGTFRSTDTHTTFPESEVHYFIKLTSFFKNDILASDADIGSTVFNVSWYIRSFGEEKAQFQIFIDKDQFAGIFVTHFFAGDSNLFKHIQRFLCKSSLRKGNGKISHISSPPFHGEELQPFLHFSISALPEWLRGD